MNFSDAELAALESGVVRLGIFFRLDVAPDPIRLWLGIGKIEAGINVRDPSGALYLGFGEIQDVPDFNQLINGAAEKVQFTLSGVSERVVNIASQNDTRAVKGKRIDVGFALMGSDWKLFNAVRWPATYRADFLTIDQPEVSSPDDPIVRSLILAAGSLFIARWRPKYSYFSNPDQQARSPGDRFCERTAIYANQFQKAWPTFPDP